MSAVSSESPRSSADLTEQADDRSSGRPASPGDHDGESQPPPPQTAADQARTDFGPNEWLVDELYQRYQADPSSVDRAWWNFFADYHPRPAEPRPAPRPGSAAGAAGDQAPPGQPQSGQPQPAQPGQAGQAQPGQAQPGQAPSAQPATGAGNGPGPRQAPQQGQAARTARAGAPGAAAGGAAPGGPAAGGPAAGAPAAGGPAPGGPAPGGPRGGSASGGPHGGPVTEADAEVTEVRLRGRRPGPRRTWPPASWCRPRPACAGYPPSS